MREYISIYLPCTSTYIHTCIYVYICCANVQGIVLSAFYWGYIMTQILGGNLSDRFGGDRVQWIAAILWTLTTFSALYMTRVSIWPLVLTRFLSGLAQGYSLPSSLPPSLPPPALLSIITLYTLPLPPLFPTPLWCRCTLPCVDKSGRSQSSGTFSYQVLQCRKCWSSHRVSPHSIYHQQL